MRQQNKVDTTTCVVAFNEVQQRIVIIRDQSVILDADVATLYGVETKRINEAVRNNKDKFPENYMFELSNEESQVLRSKFSTLDAGGRGHYSKYNYKAFTEKGLYMLATILKSKQATAATFAILPYKKAYESAVAMLASQDGGKA